MVFDGRPLGFEPGMTVLRVAQAHDLYVPTLCFHPDLPPAEACGLCAVDVEGRGLVQACATVAEQGMAIVSVTAPVVAHRRARLASILTHHPHACLVCAQAEGCARTECSNNVPESERCCARFGACELQQVAAYIGIPPDTPRYVPAGLRRVADDPLFERDPNLCVACTRCLRACRELRDVDVLERVTVAGREIVAPRGGSRLADTHCRFCGACVEVCPTGALQDADAQGAGRTERLLPCVSACPAGVDVPGYLRLTATGRFDDGLALILSRAPLPGVLGRICPAPCETACRRTGLGGATAIAAVKRGCATHGHAGLSPAQAGPATGRRVAIVGAGPAGLTAAVELRRLGHEVTLYDEQDRPGGLLRSAVPVFRLPRRIVDQDVARVLALGVTFHPAVRVGRDLTVGDLLTGYDAVLLAIGAQRARRIRLDDGELPGVHLGLDFLRDSVAGRAPRQSGRTLVVGGGSVAVDCAMTALRLGASEVVMCSLEAPEELPAHQAELAIALDEGITLMPSWGPTRVLKENGRAAGLELVRCTSVFDARGAFAPQFDGAIRTTVRGNTVILATGQEVDAGVFAGFDGRPVTMDARTATTGVDGLYACGDAVGGSSSVVRAIRSGREAALAIDRSLGGAGGPAERPDLGRGGPRLGRVEDFAVRERTVIPAEPANSRRNTWIEVVRDLSGPQVMTEAARCLQCDIRLDLTPPPGPPPRLRRLTEADAGALPAMAGVYRLYDEHKTLYAIAGTPDLRQALGQRVGSDRAAFFDYELNEMYTARESELIQLYVAEHGELPAGEEDLDDLF